MPEDLEDKLIDFELMLEGFCVDVQSEVKKTRILEYWYSLSEEIKKSK